MSKTVNNVNGRTKLSGASVIKAANLKQCNEAIHIVDSLYNVTDITEKLAIINSISDINLAKTIITVMLGKNMCDNPDFDMHKEMTSVLP